MLNTDVYTVKHQQRLRSLAGLFTRGGHKRDTMIQGGENVDVDPATALVAADNIANISGMYKGVAQVLDRCRAAAAD